MMLVAVLAAIAFLTPKPKHSASTSPLPSPVEAAKEIGSSDVCRYWRPWQVALAPHRPSDLMAMVVERSRSLAPRTKIFQEWADARPKSSEHVCAIGKKINGTFTLDLADMNTACEPGDDPLDFSMAMHVERSVNSRNLNAFTFKLTTDTLSPARLRALLADQISLVYQGYPGWHAAFPNFSDEKKSGIGILHSTDAADVPDKTAARSISTQIDWNPQRFWSRVPVLATWLLNLGALVTLDTTVKDGDGLILADIHTSTGALGTTLKVPLAKEGLLPGYLTDRAVASQPITPESNFKLVVSHTVTIGFKGLNIIVRDLAFAGEITQDIDAISYRGTFTGIGPLEVSGEYKGLAALGMGEMIRSMIKEAIEEEAHALATGNNGEGWTVHATLAPSVEHSKKYIFTLAMAFESPIHITEILRYESGEGGPVLPDRAASYEFRNYAEEVLTALLHDTRRFQCD